MIRPPKRSVTRFFVPLIDVLILLFCIFLLMPFVSQQDSAAATPDPTDPMASEAKSPDELQQQVKKLQQEVTALQLKLEQANQKIDTLKASQDNPANRMSVQVLDIDSATGKLFYFDPDEPTPRQEVSGPEVARRIVTRLKSQSPQKDVLFVVRYPQVDLGLGFPDQTQLNNYRSWFPKGTIVIDNHWERGIR